MDHSAKTGPDRQKLGYLEGIRGVSALLVMIHHFGLAFYPAATLGNGATQHTAGIEMMFYKSPLVFLNNGAWYVDIFFVLSGYVLSRRFYRTGDRDYLLSATIRRFPRLYLPVATSLLLAYLLLLTGSYYNTNASAVTGSEWLSRAEGSRGLYHFMAALIYGTMFRGNALYNSSLWTISIEWYGSLMVFASLALFGRFRYRVWLFLLLFVLLSFFDESFYAAFALGMLLNATGTPAVQARFSRRVAVLGLLAIACFLGGMPPPSTAGAEVHAGTFYAGIESEWISRHVSTLNVIGAFLLILALQQSKSLQKVFSVRPIAFLGRISFSLYLVHLLILDSFASWLFVKIDPVFGYTLSVVTVMLTYLIVTLLLADLMTRFVDDKAVAFSHYFSKRFSTDP